MVGKDGHQLCLDHKFRPNLKTRVGASHWIPKILKTSAVEFPGTPVPSPPPLPVSVKAGASATGEVSVKQGAALQKSPGLLRVPL